MDRIKIEKFKADYPEREFPSFRSLSEGESHLLRERLAQRMGCSSADPRVLFNEFESRSGLLESMSADEQSFSLSSLIFRLSIHPQGQLYLHWYRENRIDEMALSDLDANFPNIWYPGPDDLSIYDVSLGWILTIHHDGAVFYRECGR